MGDVAPRAKAIKDAGVKLKGDLVLMAVVGARVNRAELDDEVHGHRDWLALWREFFGGYSRSRSLEFAMLR